MSVTNTFTDVAGENCLEAIKQILNENKQGEQAIMITAQPGKGKSYFIKNLLYDYCVSHDLKILYLLSRKAVTDEFTLELKESHKDDRIKVFTYQSFEMPEYPAFSGYDIIICDECHYFIDDCTYNKYTDRSFNRIMNSKETLKIFMTATPDPVQEMIQEQIQLKPISLDYDYSFMNVNFFSAHNRKQRETEVKKIVSDIIKNSPEQDKGEKAIVFCDSAKFAKELHITCTKDSLFVCSRNNEDSSRYTKYIDEEAYQKMLKDHKFEQQFLFCTPALDVGFSIKDKKVKYIICLFHDWNSIEQAIGRKRINGKDDKITLYLPDYSNESIGGLMKNNQKIFTHYNYYMNNGLDAYIKKYEKTPDPSGIMYYRNIEGTGNFELAVDEFVLRYYRHEEAVLNEINSINSNAKYRTWVRGKLGQSQRYEDRAVTSISKSLQAFEESGRIFTTEDKTELAQAIGYKDKKHGTLIKGINALNEYLEKVNISYRIKVEKIKRKTFYKVVKSDA